jgi:hypothetical protein
MKGKYSSSAELSTANFERSYMWIGDICCGVRSHYPCLDTWPEMLFDRSTSSLDRQYLRDTNQVIPCVVLQPYPRDPHQAPIPQSNSNPDQVCRSSYATLGNF